MGVHDSWQREVKVFVWVLPRADADRDAFREAWGSVPTPALAGLRRYVHVTPLDLAELGDAARWCFGAAFAGGVGELWFDSYAAWRQQELALRAAYDRHLGGLADTAGATWLATRENPVVLGPAVAADTPRLKGAFHITRRPGMALEDFLAHWRTTHAEIAGCVPGTPKLLRYVQCPALPETYADAAAPSPAKREPSIAPYDGVAELWWRDAADMHEALVSPAFQEHQPRDAERFIDGTVNFGFAGSEDRRIWP